MIRILGNLVIFTLVALVGGDYDADSQTISVLHSLDLAPHASFVPRGTVSVRSLRGGGSATYLPTGVVSDAQRAQLKELVKNDGLYRLKLIAPGLDGKKTEVATFVRACHLVASGLQDTLVLTVDPAGGVIAASQLTASSECPAGAADMLERLSDFSTDVVIRQTEPGPIPDTASFIQKLEQEKLAKQRGETKDNRSFLAKYWMYIVPAVLLLMVTSGSEPPAAGR